MLHFLKSAVRILIFNRPVIRALHCITTSRLVELIAVAGVIILGEKTHSSSWNCSELDLLS